MKKVLMIAALIAALGFVSCNSNIKVETNDSVIDSCMVDSVVDSL